MQTKKRFITPELEVIKFDMKDVITDSPIGTGGLDAELSHGYLFGSIFNKKV